MGCHEPDGDFKRNSAKTDNNISNLRHILTKVNWELS